MYIEKLNEERDNKTVSLSFEAPEVGSSGIIRNNNTDSTGTRERVNSILPLDDRVNILESYNYMYVGYAFSNGYDTNNQRGRELQYLNYLYNLGNNKYALVMEPYSGTSHTKIMIFESMEEITKDMFSKIDFYESLWGDNPSVYRDYDKTKDLPWYLVMFLKQNNHDESMIVNVDLSGL